MTRVDGRAKSCDARSSLLRQNPQMQRVLDALAVAGVALQPTILRAVVAGLDSNTLDLGQSTGALEATGQDDTTRYRIPSASARAKVLAAMTDEDRTSMHSRLASALAHHCGQSRIDLSRLRLSIKPAWAKTHSVSASLAQTSRWTR